MLLKPFRVPGAKLALRSKSKGVPFIPSGEPAEVVLDLSRLLWRSFYAAPTGIDRVEYVFARELRDRLGDRLHFSAVHPAGGFYGRLDRAAVCRFLDFTAQRWRSSDTTDGRSRKGAVVRHLIAMRPRPVPRATRPRLYVQVSPHHLDDHDQVGGILRCEGARFVTLVHDIIPITHPEFVRPQGAEEHARRVQAIDSFAAGILGNSQATLEALAPHLTHGLAGRQLAVAHFGADPPDPSHASDFPIPSRPYFLYLATIEPRKNHQLLLHIWRRLAEQYGDAAPMLVLIGKRGWENENVIDILERCHVTQGHVVEAGQLSDRQIAALMAGARAMLMPSFAEGFGMPVMEALSAGVPVICSDIPPHREVGGDAPDYIDPLDGAAWLRAIDVYTPANSAPRAAQIARIGQWLAPTWPAYFDIVMDLLDRVAAHGGDD